MKLAFVSDIHGNLAALQAVIADLQARQVDQVVNLGDTLSGPLLPLETAQLLRQLPWLHVAGNHERQLLHVPLERQNPSDAYTSSCLSHADKVWLASHADSCHPALHQARHWPEHLGHDVALCHGSRAMTPSTCWRHPCNKRCAWPVRPKSKKGWMAAFPAM